MEVKTTLLVEMIMERNFEVNSNIVSFSNIIAPPV
jgi:hypothetical protein